MPIGDTWADTHQRAFQGELGEAWAGLQDGARAHVPKTAP
jgi:hypothetical protein